MRLKKTFVTITALIAGPLIATPAFAESEWYEIPNMLVSDHCREVQSTVPGGYADITICWSDDFERVYVQGVASDTASDGYHVEARIRYQTYTTDGWSSWHYRAPASDGTPNGRATERNWKARYRTRNVHAAACLYDEDKLIDCDDRGWQ